MRVVQSVAVFVTLVSLFAAALLAQPPGSHPITGRYYSGPMESSDLSWLDRPERDAEETPDKLLDIIGIEPGLTVADIGAGSGYLTLKLAKAVGASGRVYANDIQQELLALIQKKLDTHGVTNVTLVSGTQDDPRLPPSSIDVALLANVYHEFLAPQVMLRRIRQALKPGGRLALVEYRREDSRIPISPIHTMLLSDLRIEIEHEGFTLEIVNQDLPLQHVVIFTRP